MGRKLMIISCSLLMVMTMFLSELTPIYAKGSNTGETTVEYAEPPFRAQLDENATVFYNALETLYKDGDMKSGVGSFDLSTSFTQEILKNYASGNSSLAKSFQSARDAFVMDYPEIFYVDFSKVTLRLGKKDGNYVLYVNNGSNENYYSSSFTSQAEVDAAILQVNEKKNELKAILGETTLENPASIITAFHNALINHAEYTYPSKDNRDVSNVYGTLVNGTANCDGYSRTMKWLLDDYNITNVLVAGVGKNARYEENGNEAVEATMNEYHQWNYVKLDGKWYAVDVTWDDPIKNTKATGTIRTTYLLRGSDMLNENHFPLGELSDGGQTFKYPKLEKLDYGTDEESFVDLGDSSTDLKVSISKVEYTDNEGKITNATRYIVNYKNMRIEELKEQGLHIAVRYGLSETNFGPWEEANPYENNSQMDSKNLMDIAIGTKRYLQFCITKEQPDDKNGYEGFDLSLGENHEALTKIVVTPFYEDYMPAPFIRDSYPTLTETILPKKTHYAVEYYEELEKIDSTKDVSIKINNSASHIDAKVENITIKESEYDSIVGDAKTKSTIVEFDFTPDSSFQGYANVYRLEIENMQGVNSKKAPNQIPVITTYEAKLPCPMIASAGGPNSAFVMSNPKLVIDEDMSETMFQDPNGKPLKYGNLNIALVATRKTGNEKVDLDKAIGDIMADASASSTFELSLGCGSVAAALRPGYQVSVGVPYPDGFHPEDHKDIEFRAYHFKMVDGKWVSEEIVCQITPQGLMIIADSFSPFTIVAFEKEKAPESSMQAKTVNVNMESNGGKIISEKAGIGTYAINENQTRTFNIEPDEGYIIDKIILNNKEVKVSDKSTYTATFDYKTMADRNDMKVFFVSKKVIEEEKEKNIEPITPVLIPDEVVNNQPVYVDRALQATTSEGVVVKMSGILAQDVSLTLTMDPLSKEAAVSFASYKENMKTIVSGAPKLSILDAFQGDEVRYEIPVNTTSKSLPFLTYDVDKKAYVKTQAQVHNGIAIATVSGFTEFALLDDANAIPVVDKTGLQNAYDAALLLVETEYTSTTWNVFKEKREATKVVLDNASAVQSEVDAAKSALRDAQSSLVKRVNKEALRALIEKAQTVKDSGTYSSLSLEGLNMALTSATAIMKDTDATEEEVSEVYKVLEASINALVGVGDKTVLIQLVKQVNAMDLSTYTDTSAKVLTDAVQEAKKVLDNEDASQEQINANIKTVQNAIDALVRKSPINEGESSDHNGETNNGGQNGSTNTGDTSNVIVWVSLLAGSSCLLLFVIGKFLKKK